jgi:hypothetical protein
MRRAPLLGSLFTLIACSTLVPSEVLVHVDADTISRKRARQLHVRVVSQEGLTRLDRTASLFGAPPELTLPTTVPVVPTDGDSARTFTVFAELTDQESLAFNKKAATLSFVDQTLVDVDLYFSDLCIGIDCPVGQTCADGSCVPITTAPHGPTSPQVTDAQPSLCEGALCWEEPRPSGQSSNAACLWAPDAGLAIGNYWAFVLTQGVWLPEVLPSGSVVDSVACWSGGEAIATNGAGILERSPSAWKPLALGTTALHGIWGLDASDVWAVGDGGAIWRRKNHGSWAKVSSGVSTDLAGIFGLAANDIYVVGSQSTLLHYDGTAFTAVPGPAAADPAFTHVAGTSKSDLAVKAGTSVWSFDGKAWSEYAPYLGVVSLTGGPSGLLVAGGPRGTAHFRTKPGAPWGVSTIAYPFDGPGLQAVAVHGDSAIVGGEAGALARWSGSAWDSSAAWLTRTFFSGIASDPDDPSHAVVVGAAAVLERVGEGLWRRRVVGQGTEVKTPTLTSVWMGHGLSVAVGPGGAIVESPNGHDWTLVPSGSTLDLAVVDSAGSRILAGGAAGALLERGASGWSAFASPIPGAPSLTALRGVADGSWFAGTGDGSVWKFASGSSWTKLGVLPAAVSDLALDSTGGLWACADAVFQLKGGMFTKLSIGTSWTPHKILLDGVSPSWIATDGFVYQRDADGTYAEVGPAATAIAVAANGRFFMAGIPGRILAQRAP